MNIRHSKIASKTNKVTGTDWNDVHVVEGFDEDVESAVSTILSNYQFLNETDVNNILTQRLNEEMSGESTNLGQYVLDILQSHQDSGGGEYEIHEEATINGVTDGDILCDYTDKKDIIFKYTYKTPTTTDTSNDYIGLRLDTEAYLDDYVIRETTHGTNVSVDSGPSDRINLAKGLSTTGYLEVMGEVKINWLNDNNILIGGEWIRSAPDTPYKVESYGRISPWDIAPLRLKLTVSSNFGGVLKYRVLTR